MKTYNLFSKWLLSYLWVLALPLLFGILLHTASLHAIREEADRLLSKDINQDIQTIEGMFHTSQDICSTLLNTSMITSFTADSSDPGYALKERDIQSLLHHLKTANSTIHSIYLYYPKTGLFLGDSITLRSKDSNNLFRFRFALDRELLLDYIDQSYPNQFYIIEEPSETSASLLYISSFSSLSGTASSGQAVAILLLLKDSRIQQHLATEDISILLEDRFGHTLTLKETLTPEATQLIKDLTLLENTDSAFLQNNSYCIQVRSQNFYTLYAVMKNDRYREKLQDGRRLLLFYILFCGITGSAIAYFLAKRQYSPIQELLEMTSRASKEDSVLPATEYDAIRQSIQTLLSQYQENQTQLQRQNIQLQSNSLAALLRSRHTSRQTDLSYYKRFTSSFSSERYLLFHFDLADITEDADATVSQQINDSAKTEDVLYFLLSNVIERFLPPETKLVSSRIEDYFYFLMEADAPLTAEETPPIDNTAETAQTLRQIILFLQETYHLMVWGNISNIHSGLDGILTAYQELCRLTNYRNRIGSNQAVLEYSQIAAQPDILSQLQLWDQEQLAVRYIENHQYELVSPLLASLSQHTEAVPPTEPVSVLDARMQEVASYIKQHYTDPQLSVAALAEQFHFSVSYLSRKFKEKRGIGILTYLNQLRLQRAKELLTDGLSVTDTASAVGFYTTRPLLRLFHDEEGITPVEYQRQQREL